MLLNIDEGSLLGYRVGDYAPASFEGGHLQVFEDGYAINVFDGRISSIFICCRDGYEGFRDFKGELQVKERVFQFDQETNFEKVVQAFGNPIEQWNDGVEMCAEFKVNEFQVEVIWHVDGELSLDYVSIEKPK